MKFAGQDGLYDPREHVPVLERPWSEDTARAAIAEIAGDLARGWSAHGGWPLHPDELPEATQTHGEPGIYCGAAGVIWALKSLRSAGYAIDLDLLALACQTSPASWSDGKDWHETSYFAGPLGLALVRTLLGDDGLQTRIDELIQRNLDNPSHEVFVGTPGSMLAAISMYERSGDPRWSRVFIRGLENLMQAWVEIRKDVYLWKQRLYGRNVPSYIGPGHGFAGAVAIALRGSALLDAATRHEIQQRALSTTKALSARDPDATNWPRTNWPGALLVKLPRWPLQWCHGAPGVVASLSVIPAGMDEEFDRLLLEGGETVWQAGPLAKGAGICHGTAGNGYSFLKLYTRTKDAKWLHRARAFAMHAIGQMRSQRERWGVPWYSLWTGDAGVALYLEACITGTSDLLAFDTLS